jgi:hypothetical protein
MRVVGAFPPGFDPTRGHEVTQGQILPEAVGLPSTLAALMAPTFIIVMPYSLHAD